MKLLFVTLFTVLFSFVNPWEASLAPGPVQEIFKGTNEFRQSKGLAALEIRSDLNEIARQHSVDMAEGRVAFGHDGFTERNELAKKSLGSMHSFAENVAYGANSGTEVVDMWKNSKGHRQNMLGPFRYIGIGIARNSEGVLFFTQVFAG